MAAVAPIMRSAQSQTPATSALNQRFDDLHAHLAAVAGVLELLSHQPAFEEPLNGSALDGAIRLMEGGVAALEAVRGFVLEIANVH
ncbi:hypothetical protein [Sphingomonas sp. CCH9-E2]|uniref:hypothetical protein n=1 Tax=Sphingomonas sp. CCH9-E2 TaxID=1768776 RepID=UPI000A73BEC9|nr:hypothetical protein [Sphingomonas sp. CCH9-E2]